MNMNMSTSSVLKNVFLYFCISMLFINPSLHLCKAADTFCNGTANFTEGSKMASNRNIVLDKLAQRASSSGGFNTCFEGQSPDEIYGLLQCRGDLTAEECQSCSVGLNTIIRRMCAYAVGARVFLNDKCYLHYENYNFFGQLDNTTQQYRLNGENASTDPHVFSSAVKGLFSNLSAKVSESSNLYSSGTTTDSPITKIYGLVECLKDISIKDCTTCLARGIGGLLNVSAGGYRLGALGWFGSCLVEYQTHPFFTSASTSTPPTLQTPSSTISPSTQRKSSNKIPIIVGFLGGFIFLVLLGGLLFTALRKFKFSISGKGRYSGDLFIEEALHQIMFSLETLTVATRNFHVENKLGEGGFGVVYKGTMPNGREIAVKKLSIKSLQGKKEFLNEVNLVAKIQHRNLVSLLGCCTEGSESLLVYEYVANKSLDKILFDPQRNRELDWQIRLNIITGIARGLLYLHEDCHPRIIHRDIKASNILLDEQMNPKIADFGLARLFPEDETHISTRVAGTYGYLAPEYAMHGQLSDKADVYSFGVVLLEVVSGRKNIDIKLPVEVQGLLELVWACYNGGNAMDIIDREIIESCPEDQGSRWIHVGLLCTQEDASLRPPMSIVYSMLLKHSVTNLPNPAKPAFISVTHNREGTPSMTYI